MAWTFLIYLQATLSSSSLWSRSDPTTLRPPDTSPSPFTLSTVTHHPPRFHPISSTSSEPAPLCLGLHDVFIALFLVMLILLTIFGNVLVVLSVFVYKRMRTFTNILLTSLATADLLVGLIIMPLSLLDLLHSHQWPFGQVLCSIWATSDVLLCTASILNLCVISLDRYMAITSPLKYPRTRSRKMAAGLLSSVWLLSLIVCSPPWFVPDWNLFKDYEASRVVNGTHIPDKPITCAYSKSPAYRIYSAMGSFYLPLLVMLSVYFKIFRVASEREALMRQSIGTCRLSNRVVKTQQKNQRHNPRMSYRQHRNGDSRECASAPIARNRIQMGNNNGTRPNYSMRPIDMNNRQHTNLRRMDSRVESTSDNEDSGNNQDSTELSQGATGINISNGPSSPKKDMDKPQIERECLSLADLADKAQTTPPRRKNTEVRTENVARRLQPQTRLQPSNLMAKAHEHYQTCGPGKVVRGSKEKMVYLRERKALKTIGIVVLGFIVCWMPFFVLYLLEVFIIPLQTNVMFNVLNDFFLWLGYSNSVLNPIIYTMYNGDFRRCFRDLLSFGCIQHHRRTMSVKKLHQQSTIF